jgi:ubiquinone/menaquinone biosynthesis C-methylase UbiE
MDIGPARSVRIQSPLPTSERDTIRRPDNPIAGADLNSSRVHLRRRVHRFAHGTEPGMLVLDAGAGTSPYRELFGHARYEAADFAQLKSAYAPLDYVCDLTDIPVESERFDRVLFNQVLEHLPEPDKALAELHRVLKHGGRILCSVPLFYAEHQVPYDYYRYTRFALRRLFERAGFEIERIDWLEGYFGTVSYQFQQMHQWLPADIATIRTIAPGWRSIYLAPLVLLTRALAGRLQSAYGKADVRWKYTAKGMPKNYVVIARKPKRADDANSR